MINRYTIEQQICPHCHSENIDHIGTQAFCSSCLRFASNLKQELRVVPEQYESNARNRRELQKDRKLNALIREFSDKHRQLRSKEELQVFRQKLRGIKVLTPNRKGSREAAAVVVYCMMEEQIKMTIKEYCKNNNLNVKLFNQKYIVYRQLEKKQPQQHCFLQPEPRLFFKQEESENKLEQSPTERESADGEYYDSKVEGEQIEQDICLVDMARHAIQHVYDKLFTKYIYKEKKSLVIQGLTQKFETMSKEFMSQIKFNQNKPLKIYYLIFAVIKQLGHKLTFAEYAEVILKQTGYHLKRRAATEARKSYQLQAEQPNQCRDEAVVKIEDKGTENTIQEYKVQPQKKQRKGRRSSKKEKERVELSDSELDF